MKFLTAAFLTVVLVSSLASAAPTKVAFVGAFTGSDPNTSNELYRGYEVFKHLVKSHASLMAVQKFDNKGSVAETVNLVNQINENGINIIVGIARSDEAIAAARTVASKPILFLTPFATNSKIVEFGDNVFQICFNDIFQGQVLARLTVNELRPRSIVIFENSESLYSQGLTESYNNELSKLNPGIKVHRISYIENDLNPDALARKAESLKPQLVFIPDHITRAALIAKSVNQKVSNVRFLGGDGFGGKKILTGVFGDTPKINLLYTTHWHQDISTEKNRQFIRAYRTLFPGDEPTSGAALAFDTFSILADALKNSSTHSPEVLSKFIRQKSFLVTTGNIRFGLGSTKQVKKQAVVLHLQDRKYGFHKTFN